jgi:hypothetical protein
LSGYRQTLTVDTGSSSTFSQLYRSLVELSRKEEQLRQQLYELDYTKAEVDHIIRSVGSKSENPKAKVGRITWVRVQ